MRNCPECGYEFSTDELRKAAKEVARQYGLKGARLRYKKKEFPQKRAPRTAEPKPTETMKWMKGILGDCGLGTADGD
jgi:hypothetical protein